MKKPLCVLAAAFAAAAIPAVAGPYDQPWAVVESGDNSEVRKESRVAITQVDGVSTRNPRKSDPLAPGNHKVRISFETARGVVADNFREMDMALEGCTRYRVVANYTNKTSPEWKPMVYPEPITECKSKFKK